MIVPEIQHHRMIKNLCSILLAAGELSRLSGQESFGNGKGNYRYKTVFPVTIVREHITLKAVVPLVGWGVTHGLVGFASVVVRG